MPEGFVPDYGYLADLCSANGWSLGIWRVEAGRMALRVYECRGGELLAGAIFTADADLDVVAEVVFDVLRHREFV